MNELHERMIEIPLNEYLELRRGCEINTWIIEEYANLKSRFENIDMRLFELENIVRGERK